MGCHPSHGGVQAPIGVLLVLAALGKEGLSGCLQLGSQCHTVRKGLPLLHPRSGVSVEDGYPSQGKLKRGSSFSLLVKWSLASTLALLGCCGQDQHQLAMSKFFLITWTATELTMQRMHALVHLQASTPCFLGPAEAQQRPACPPRPSRTAHAASGSPAHACMGQPSGWDEPLPQGR